MSKNNSKKTTCFDSKTHRASITTGKPKLPISSSKSGNNGAVQASAKKQGS